MLLKCIHINNLIFSISVLFSILFIVTFEIFYIGFMTFTFSLFSSNFKVELIFILFDQIKMIHSRRLEKAHSAIPIISAYFVFYNYCVYLLKQNTFFLKSGLEREIPMNYGHHFYLTTHIRQYIYLHHNRLSMKKESIFCSLLLLLFISHMIIHSIHSMYIVHHHSMSQGLCLGPGVPN